MTWCGHPARSGAFGRLFSARGKGWARLFLPVAAALVLAGCSSGGGLYALGAVETVSVVNTDKLLSDHVVSAVSGRDCSSSRRQRENTPYCIDYDHDPPPKREAVYCYRTLASVSCYDAPNPYGTDVRVGTPLGTAQGR